MGRHRVATRIGSQSIRVVVRVHSYVCLSLPAYSGRDHFIMIILVMVQRIRVIFRSAIYPIMFNQFTLSYLPFMMLSPLSTLCACHATFIYLLAKSNWTRQTLCLTLFVSSSFFRSPLQVLKEGILKLDQDSAIICWSCLDVLLKLLSLLL